MLHCIYQAIWFQIKVYKLQNYSWCFNHLSPTLIPVVCQDYLNNLNFASACICHSLCQCSLVHVIFLVCKSAAHHNQLIWIAFKLKAILLYLLVGYSGVASHSVSQAHILYLVCVTGILLYSLFLTCSSKP